MIRRAEVHEPTTRARLTCNTLAMVRRDEELRTEPGTDPVYRRLCDSRQA
jgi:hypothetical protein